MNNEDIVYTVLAALLWVAIVVGATGDAVSTIGGGS